MTNKDFDIIAKEQFSFLKTEYEFNLLKCDKEDWGYELFYKNNTTGIKITYEYQAAYLFIMVYRLIDGDFCENPRNIKEDTVLYGYGLDDIINLQNADALIKPAYEYGDKSEYYDKDKGLTLYVSAFAKNLKLFSAKILQGDFTIFSDADKIVKERIKTYK